MIKLTRLLGASLTTLLLLSVAFAQDFRGTITGRVMDASKASIPNATVTVKNAATNEVFTATTNNEGNYRIPFLRPGDYNVTVEAQGFKKAARENFVVAISQIAAVDFTLEAGQITDTVTIEASGQVALESASADRGGVIDRQKVIELPLNARNPFMLGVLVAGVNFNGASIWQRPFDNGAIAQWTINGSQQNGNEFLLDGAPNNGQAGGNNIAYVPPVDAVQEFKIMTNTYDAQYGKTTGGIINVNLRSGTNAFHGTIYEFFRREWLDATDFRFKAEGQYLATDAAVIAGRAKVGDQRRPKPKHWLDQYGFLVEGPVRIPWLYNGKDKTFFMFNYEGYREGVPSPLNLSVPMPEMLDGDFSKLVDGAGRPIVIYDPLTGRADATAPGGWRRDPFPGNKIPAARLNPIAKKILGFQPKSNRSDPVAGYARSNLFLPLLATDAFFNYVFKIDQQFNEKHRMYVRFAQNDRTEDRNGNGVFSGPGQDGQQPFKRINDAFVADHLANFSPTFIFNFRVSFNRFIEDGFGAGNLDFDKTTLGFPASLVSQVPGTKSFGRYTFADYNSLGRFRGNNLTNTIASHPSFTWIRGSQTWRGGVDMRFTQFITKNEGSPFLITGSRGFTQARFDQGDANSGDSIASFLLGYVGGQSDYNLFPTTLGKYYAPWFQNDWKVNRRLTLNLGARWDVNVAPNERYNRLNRGFDATITNPADSLVNRTTFPTLPKLLGGLNFAGVNGIERIAANTDWNNIQPRAGFAYLLNDKLVMRGGWGMYFVNPSNAYLQFNGFQVTSGVINSLDGGRTPIQGLINNPFPTGIAVPSGAAGGASTFLGRGFSFVNPNFQIPYVHQFSLGFQYQLPWESKLEVSYVGNRTLKLQTDRGFNEPDLAFRQKCNPLEGGNPVFCNEALPNPFRGLAPFAGTNHFTATTLSRFQLARPYPHFAGFTEVTRNDGRIDYNSLQVTFEKRARNGLNIVSTYTFSRQIEEWGFNDLQKGIKQRGLYLTDRPHRFTTGLVYQLPFGQGQKLFNVKNGFLNRIVSGWQSSLILQWQSGRPQELNENVQWINPDAYLKDIKWKGSDQVWAFRTYPDKANPAVRSVCAARVLDNGTLALQSYSANLEGCTLANVDMIRRPNFAPRFTSFRDSSLRLHAPPSADLSFNKQTRITERIGLQLRVEMFNFTNTYSFWTRQFTNNPDDRNFGSQFPRTAGNTEVAYPRHIQLAAKIIF